MDARDGETLFSHLLGEFLYLLLLVQVDNALGDLKVLEELAEGLELPFGLLHRDEELLDTDQGQFLLLHKDGCWISHELLGDLEDVWWHRGGEEADLEVSGQLREDLVDVFLESSTEDLVSLIEDEELEALQLHEALGDHVEDTAWSTNDDLLAFLEGSPLGGDVGSSRGAMNGKVHKLSEALDDSLDLLGELAGGCEDKCLGLLDSRIDHLEHSNGEGTSLSCSGLRLGDSVLTLDDGQDPLLLNL